MNNKKLMNGLIKRSSISVAVGLFGFFTVQTASAATCEHVVNGEWRDGFVAKVDITNTGEDPIEGWSVNWEYPNATIASLWNADLSGDGSSFVASNLGWNKYIYPGETVSFGFVAEKTVAGDMGAVVIYGDICELAILPESTPTPFPHSDDLHNTPYITVPGQAPPPDEENCNLRSEFLQYRGLDIGDSIEVKWSGKGGESYHTLVGGEQILRKPFYVCPSSVLPSPELRVDILDSGAYTCSVESEPKYSNTLLLCEKEGSVGSTPTPYPIPVTPPVTVTPVPATPVPVTPVPVTPVPVTPVPVTPVPVTPVPVTPVPVTPVPVTPVPVTPPVTVTPLPITPPPVTPSVDCYTPTLAPTSTFGDTISSVAAQDPSLPICEPPTPIYTGPTPDPSTWVTPTPGATG